MSVAVTVREMANRPFSGWYLATRKKDGFYYVKVNYGGRQSRKWLKPSMVTFKESLEGKEIFVDKYTELA